MAKKSPAIENVSTIEGKEDVTGLPAMPENVIPEKEAVIDIPETIQIPVDNSADSLPQNPSSENGPKIYDEFGTAFDPAIHISPTNKTKTGKFRRKTVKNSPQVDGGEGTPVNSPQIVGQTFARLFVTGGVCIFGSDFAPSKREEYDELSYSFQNWADANDIQDLSPNVALVLACISYSTMKLSEKPQCKETFKNRVVNKVKSVWYWIKSKRSNNGKDKMRENIRPVDEEKTA